MLVSKRKGGHLLTEGRVVPIATTRRRPLAVAPREAMRACQGLGDRGKVGTVG